MSTVKVNRLNLTLERAYFNIESVTRYNPRTLAPTASIFGIFKIESVG